MSFLWREMLWLLLLIPILVGLYVLLLKRKKKAAVRYASLAMVKEAMGPGQRFRRHIPPLLFLLALTLMIVAIARPAATVTLPTQQETVILAMDVSGSMRAPDVQPNRLSASQAAAKAFIADQPLTTRIGIVSFAATAALVQPPTQNREELLSAIDRFQLQRGTATGSGLLVALATLFPNEGIDVSAFSYGQMPRDINQESTNTDMPIAGSSKPKEPFKRVPPGSNASAAIVLLSDGQRTTGPDPIEAARMAAERGIRVFTVGMGTKEGETIGFEGWSMRVRLDEETLKQIADMTRGEYFYAGNAIDLKKIYESLNSRIAFETKQTEITALFSAAAALLAMLSAALSLMWFNRVL